MFNAVYKHDLQIIKRKCVFSIYNLIYVQRDSNEMLVEAEMREPSGKSEWDTPCK